VGEGAGVGARFRTAWDGLNVTVAPPFKVPRKIVTRKIVA